MANSIKTKMRVTPFFLWYSCSSLFLGSYSLFLAYWYSYTVSLVGPLCGRHGITTGRGLLFSEECSSAFNWISCVPVLPSVGSHDSAMLVWWNPTSWGNLCLVGNDEVCVLMAFLLLIRFLMLSEQSLTVSVLVWLIARWVVPVPKCHLSIIVRLVPRPLP